MMNRAECFKVIAQHVSARDVVVSSYSSLFDWLALDLPGLPYLAVGAMGLDTSHALGFALAMPDRRIVTLQGDGSLSNAFRTEEDRPESAQQSVARRQVRRPLASTAQDDQLLLEQEILRHHRSDTPGAKSFAVTTAR
jgi:hypothetical protein